MSRKKLYQEGPVIHHYKFRRKPNRSVAGDVGIYIFLAICSFVMLFPLLYAIANSLKPLDELLKFPPTVLPRRPTFDNFSDLLVTMSQSWVPFSRYLFNTVFMFLQNIDSHLEICSL